MKAAVRGAACLAAAIALLLPRLLVAQQQAYVDVTVVPDRPGWVYRVGETARFHVSVLRAGYPVDAAKVRYEVGPELMPPRAQGPLVLTDGRAVVDGGTMDAPGFVRLLVVAEVEGKEYRGYGTAGFDPEAIRPVATMPDDFSAYWSDALRKARAVPLEPTMTLVPERSTAAVNVYHVSFQNERPGSRLYGMLSVPAAPGTYPAVLEVPGAGVRPYQPNVYAATRGVIHLALGIHGLPVNLDPKVYTDLAAGALANYWTYGLDDRDSYYYRRVILGAVRAGDFLASLPQFDGTHYGVYGSSQGGALAIITAALDERVTALGAIHPALSDHEGFRHGRAGGWPHLFAPWNAGRHETPQKIATARYYDVVNFARLVRVPGFYTWGFNDTVCPPTSMYAAYNVLAAPKVLFLVQETGHWTYPEQWERVLNSLLDRFAPRR